MIVHLEKGLVAMFQDLDDLSIPGRVFGLQYKDLLQFAVQIDWAARMEMLQYERNSFRGHFKVSNFIQSQLIKIAAYYF